ncbi:Protein-glutamate methylesterase [Salinisphaera shabanensis E1L3A]|uniref:protein-glutamate methylesterase n=1 Tax=Salinisphaera shabanensis E1L3A TaxID=1033802 RepID=U2E4X7_9GAMM|nr:chemotaxis protein CheB [Salinisphaera shabanensis]ERJ18891.1 Protein-glutamate methylesterase [Salinisphaera shabanensis E1L3A]
MSESGYAALAIGGSAGSLEVLCGILEGLVSPTRLAVVVCLHTASREIGELCTVLSRHSALPVIEAQESAAVAPNQVHVAGGGYHLLVERAATFALCAGPRIQYARPSIDVLFESMADTYRRRLAGMLLSGANGDGAAGLRAIHRLGGLTIVQSPETASAPEMPQAALKLFAPDRQNTPDQLIDAVRGISRLAR